MVTEEVHESWSQILLDKVVFVTGAGGGIGSAISRTCALHGAKVVVSDINKAAADKVVADILESEPTQSDRIISLQVDTVDEQAIEQAVKIVVGKWGTIHVLVNVYVCMYNFNKNNKIFLSLLLFIPLSCSRYQMHIFRMFF